MYGNHELFEIPGRTGVLTVIKLSKISKSNKQFKNVNADKII